MAKAIVSAGGGGGSTSPYEAQFLFDNWEIIKDSARENQWKWERFSSITTDVNALATLATRTPAATNYYNDSSTSITMNITDSYTARCTIYIKCPEAVTMTFTCCTDDAGYIWLNGDPVTNLVSCTTKSVTFNFIKGVNQLIFIYTEGSGGDGWYTSPHLVTKVGAEFEWICGAVKFVQTVPIKPTPRNYGLTFLKSIAESAEDLKNKKLIWESEIYINTDKTVTSTIVDPPTVDTKIYFTGGNTTISPTSIIFTSSESNGQNWWRVYGNGWCEQGGRFNSSANGDSYVTVNLHIPFINTDYTIFDQQEQSAYTGNWGAGSASIRNVSKTTSSFVLSVDGCTNTTGYYWEAKGWVDTSNYI